MLTRHVATPRTGAPLAPWAEGERAFATDRRANRLLEFRFFVRGDGVAVVHPNGHRYGPL